MGFNAGKFFKKVGIGAGAAALGIDTGRLKLPDELPEPLAEELAEIVAAGVYKALVMVNEGAEGAEENSPETP